MIHIAHGGTKFQKPDEHLPNQFLHSTKTSTTLLGKIQGTPKCSKSKTHNLEAPQNESAGKRHPLHCIGTSNTIHNSLSLNYHLGESLPTQPSKQRKNLSWSLHTANAFPREGDKQEPLKEF